MLPRRDSKPLDYPALLPMFGGMEKKPRFLDREVITMGRARGSDFCLDGNEVSALHCIIFKAVDGYRVRDCGSRTGTRVNGQAIKNSLLGNGDVLQIGPFSFEVRIPAGMETGTVGGVDPTHVDRLKRSRSHLVHLALRLRKKLMTRKAPQISDAFPPPTPVVTANLADSSPDDKRAAELKAKIKQYDAKVNQLEESEKELFEEQEALKKQKRDFETQAKTHAAEIAARKKELEDEFQNRWEAVQEELKSLKNAVPPTAGAAAAALLRAPESGVTAALAGVANGPTVTPEQLKELETLEAKKKELHAMAEKLKARDKELNDDYKEILRERDALDKQRAQWEQEQFEARKQLDDQKENLSSAEFSLKDQKSQLGTMIDQLRTMQEELRASAMGDADKFQAEIAQLKKELADARSGGGGASTAELAAAKAEIAALQQSLQQAGGINGEVQALQKEMLETQAMLQKKVQTLGADNEALRAQLSARPAEVANDPRVQQLEAENEQLKRLADELGARFASQENYGDEAIALKHELEALRAHVAQLEQAAPAASGDNDLAEENRVLRRLLDEAETDLHRLKQEGGGNGSDGNADELQGEIDRLRKLVKDKEDLISDLKNQEPELVPGGDPQAYEAELHRFRKELESDRARLSKEIESLRVRNQELDEATREMEMELSRERAEMARERIRLDRMREEVKADMERLQREQEVRGTLAPVQKLREELLQKSANGGPPKSTTDRLRTMSKLQ